MLELESQNHQQPLQVDRPGLGALSGPLGALSGPLGITCLVATARYLCHDLPLTSKLLATRYLSRADSLDSWLQSPEFAFHSPGKIPERIQNLLRNTAAAQVSDGQASGTRQQAPCWCAISTTLLPSQNLPHKCDTKLLRPPCFCVNLVVGILEELGLQQVPFSRGSLRAPFIRLLRTSYEPWQKFLIYEPWQMQQLEATSDSRLVRNLPGPQTYARKRIFWLLLKPYSRI